jgi:transposase
MVFSPSPSQESDGQGATIHAEDTRDLRQKWELGRTHRPVAASVGASAGAVAGAVSRAGEAGLDWVAVQALSEDELEARLYPAMAARAGRPLPDWGWIHAERRKAGVTLELLHLEYLEKHPAGYRYSQFCDYYREWLAKRSLTMRQEHRAGDKAFVDYSGKPRIVDGATGEEIEVELFVPVLGASNYTFAEATMTQRGPDWIASHRRALAHFGGVPKAIVPDQLKSGVTRSCRYEPGIQRTYEEMAAHYGTTVLPARPYRALDEAKVEVAVQVAQRWILARLCNQTFFSLDALNERIAELLEELNARDSVGCGTPVSSASLVALAGCGPVMLRTIRAFTLAAYSIGRFRSRPARPVWVIRSRRQIR